MRAHYIPTDLPFLKTLATWVLQEHGPKHKDGPAALTKLLILLPNRRACRSLREAFLECNNGVPLLLPRMQPLGELDEDPTFLPETPTDIPPAIPSMRRELILTRIVRAFKTKQGSPYSLEQAAQLAKQLAQLLDDVARENITLAQLSRLVPEEFALHWQQTLEFLNIISHEWPAILEREGAIDAVDHRTRTLKATAALWRAHPPAHPIIAAGSTGSQPATADLLAAIASLPQGRIILPGLDTAMPEHEWNVLSETHPQFTLKNLLTHLNLKREQVTPLTHTSPSPLAWEGRGGGASRVTILSAIFQPPAATAHWAQSTLPLEQGLSGLRLLTTQNQHDEARLIAIALRETLETPAKTAALITPDRTLARMVAAQLARLGIDIDDSAGQKLGLTPSGAFLRLVIESTASESAPANLLALLRHPLAAAGYDPAECRRFSRNIEKLFLRGLRRDPGLASLAAARHKNSTPAIPQFLKHLAETEKPLADLFHSKTPVPLRTLLKAHIDLAESLAATPDEKGPDRLWRGDSGEQTAAFLAELLENADLLPEVEPHAYPGLFALLLNTNIFRPRYGKHPRLHILSPIEARLQYFDRVILASLNEGTWPATTTADPWMSRPMREQFGLPASARSIGQSAHDFTMLATAPETILSRAEKVEGTPTIPSRWLVRLTTLVQGLNKPLYDSLACQSHYLQGLEVLHTPQTLPQLTQPTYSPPLSARPRKLPVTAIDIWVKNPYNLYARYILKLRPLDELDQDPGASDYGELIHKAMEILTRDFPTGTIENIEHHLREAGKEAFAHMLDRPAIAILWWPRFEAMIPWLSSLENTRRATGIHLYSEVTGIWTFPVDGTTFTLTAKLDRMEIKNGQAAIADYKTGTPPTEGKVEEGLANQLPLQALVAQYGTFENIQNPTAITDIEYWYLGGSARKCDIKPIDTALIPPAKDRLETLIRTYAQPATAYTAPLNPTTADERYNDYEHLTRRQEWDPV